MAAISLRKLDALMEQLNHTLGKPLQYLDADGATNVGHYYLATADDRKGLRLEQITAPGGVALDVLKLGYMTKHMTYVAVVGYMAGYLSKETEL